MAKLFDSLTIGPMTLANRLVMPPMATAKAGEKDRVTDEICDYYRERAKHGKIGLIITEHCYVHQSGKAHPAQLSIASDDDIAGLRRLTDTIHGEGVKVIAQISHAGSAAKCAVTGQQPLGPSALLHPRHKDEMPLEMTREQIHEMTQCFAEAARRAQKAGFDGVEIHSAHGYLLCQYYSPVTNHRSDEYGAASVENRTRFHCEVVSAVRQATGPDFTIAMRLGGCDYVEGGSTVDDCVEACRLFEACGVDLIHLSGGVNGYVRPGHSEPGYFQDMSLPVKAAVGVPVLLTGGVTKLTQAEELVADDSADLIGVGRALYANPHWAEEA